MDNQHKKIKGYRDLTQEEIDLMNEIKEKGIELQALVEKINSINIDLYNNGSKDGEIRGLIDRSECIRWTSIAKTNLQQGIMALTRAVAKPEFF